MKRLIESLEKCAEAHKATKEHLPMEGQFIIYDCNVPLLTDVQDIVYAFSSNILSIEWSTGFLRYITIFLDELYILPNERIDWELLKMSLPTDTELSFANDIPCDFTHLRF